MNHIAENVALFHWFPQAVTFEVTPSWSDSRKSLKSNHENSTNPDYSLQMDGEKKLSAESFLKNSI